VPVQISREGENRGLRGTNKEFQGQYAVIHGSFNYMTGFGHGKRGEKGKKIGGPDTRAIGRMICSQPLVSCKHGKKQEIKSLTK